MVCDTTGFIPPEMTSIVPGTFDTIHYNKTVQQPIDTTFQVSTGVKMYAAAGVCWLLWSTYRDGKAELEYARSQSRFNPKKDHDAAFEGCFKRPFDNIFDAIIWPIPVVLNLVPKVVVWLNPK